MTSAADRRARVDEPHVAPLNALVRSWRHGGRFVPWVDPDGGGTAARVLVLMEAPGPATVAAGELGFSSEDNPDPTARVFKALREESGLARADYLRWNVVPWALRDTDGRHRPPRVEDLAEAQPALRDLARALPELRVVVTLGAPALTGMMRLLTVEEPPRLLPVLGVPHPSLRNGHRRAETRQRILVALRTAAAAARA
ncbi:uracil-DNA glycosylase [Kocuria aegyptia]|uniref:Uracil-DNA glycosylase-like domain-containing protein n=1 Tax=Kocuria aegyptia TaxID=330943 RepID=A0ABN2KTG0_9MICC